MPDRPEQDLLNAAAKGDERAFERLYDRYHQRVRLVAWRISHRADWVDDLLNEAWLRAFHQRQGFDPTRDFLVWVLGIVRNVYREFCRTGKLTVVQLETGGDDPESDEASPEEIVREVETLAALNECFEQLSPEDAAIIRLRFFENQPLRVVAQEVGVPEATLRASRIPQVVEALRRCLSRKKIEISDFFPAQAGD